MDKFFKVSALSAAMMGAVVAAPAMAEDPLGPEYAAQFQSFSLSRLSAVTLTFGCVLVTVAM